MSISNKTYQPVQLVTIKANEDLPAFRFVNYSGNLCQTETLALGVTEVDWKDGDYASVVTLGTIIVETDSAIDVGVPVTSSDQGKAMAASGTVPVNGVALDACSGAGFIRIKLVP
jgi:hypothetical protein